MSKSKNRMLRNLLINPRFQAAVILHSVIVSFLMVLIQFLSLKYYFHKYLMEGKDIGLQASHPFFRFIAEQQAFMNTVFIVTSLVLVFVSVISALVLSHRIAGPIHRLKMFFGFLGDKDQGAFSFRKGDFFQDLPPIINDGLSKAKIRVSKETP